MATRGIIARKTDSGIEGRYHHWDSYPEGLGAALWHAYHETFHSDGQAMMKVLIDDHPAGWSSIVQSDLSKPAGFNNKEGGPQCYCHGERHEPAHPPLTKLQEEYGYVFDVNERTLTVHRDDSNETILYSLDGPEPEWAQMFTSGE